MRRTIAAVVAALVLSGCGSAEVASVNVTASPSSERNVPVFITAQDLPAITPADAPLGVDSPQRIAALAIGVGETLVALGAADRIVARDEASSAPQIDAAPVVTKAHVLSAERVLATKPDLAIVDELTSPPEAVDQLRAAGVTVVEVPQAWSVEDMPARVRAVGQAVGASPGAIDDVIARMDTQPAASPAERPKVAFLYLRGTSAIYLLGGKGSGADDLIARAGGIDVGASAGLAAFTPLTAEALAAANPDAILVMTEGLASVGGLDGLRSLPGVAQTRAGRDGNVIAVDDTVLLSFGPRTPALIDALTQALQQVTGS